MIWFESVVAHATYCLFDHNGMEFRIQQGCNTHLIRKG